MYMNIFNNLEYKLFYQNIIRNYSWISPKGFDTGIKVYNCVSRRKEPLILKRKNVVTWYTCGPTVYDSSHIGHASCFIKLDIIQKILSNYFKYNVITCMNITDVDDKIIKRASELGVKCTELTKKYEKELWFDLKCLKVEEPTVVLRVTEQIPYIISFIEKLIDNGQAYKASDHSVYFDVNSVKKYGKLQNIGTQEENKPSGVKKHVMDFALWKSRKDEDLFWKSPWGEGRPGWHIECSALASKIFGSNIDIHAGGIDLRFPHHENEEAQSCAYHDTPQWVNYWMHTGHLQLSNSEKMSKSLGNTLLIQEMLKSVSPEVFRMACSMSRYEYNMEYSEKLIATAKSNYNNFKNCIQSCNEFKNGFLKASINSELLNEHIHKCSNNIHSALCDDFDTPSVIKYLNQLVSTTNSMLHSTPSSVDQQGLVSILGVQNLISSILESFGFRLNDSEIISKDFNEIVDVLNVFRQDVRNLAIVDKNKELLQLCDKVRDNAKKCGINFKDRGQVSSWSL
ncbi:probable cysteine--tRNA ligase, mitochondrial isoform X2 [Diabrotica undecimpunctata]|uniref:probable cysteine--tRNA ligase, mitochondrial isoform X2 n=1 Tax=Diabrotica undecimpunctata TaxID=50387 RepID=UPI003B63CE1C